MSNNVEKYCEFIGNKKSVIADPQQSYRSLALEGLGIETLRGFDFFLGEEDNVYVTLQTDDCTDFLDIHSVAFEHLYRYYAESKGIELSEDEWIIQLIQIELFVECTESEFICDDCAEQMEEELY